MIEIPDPPTQRVCASCSSPLSWLYSPRSRSWISVVRVDDTTVRLHRCRTTGGPVTWRDVARRADPPNDAYRAARAALAARTAEHRHTEEETP